MVYIPGVYNRLEEVQRAGEHAERLIEQVNVALFSADAAILKFVAHWFYQFDLFEDNTPLPPIWLAMSIW